MTTPQLHVTDFGEAGSPVLFCHGLFGQGKNWTNIAKGLADRHRVRLVDMPDHGKSGWTESFDYLAAADVVASLLTEPTAVVGHSMGGKIAMAMALRHPALVSRLCVVDVAPVAYQRTSEFAGYMDAMLALDLGSLERRDQADAALAPAVPNPVVRGFLMQNLRRDAEGWRWQPNLALLRRDLATIGGWPDERLAGLAPYPGPVLWVGGANSDYITDEYAPAMERWFPRLRRVTVKGAGHWVHSEQPATFAEVMDRFVDTPV